MKVPVIGESINEVTLSQWLKEDGEIVSLDEPICEFESDKATLEFPAEAAGKLVHVAKEGDDLEIGALVAKIDTSVSADATPAPSPATSTEAPKAEEKTPAPAPPMEAAPAATYASRHPSPAAAKILKENAIPPQSVQGQGKDGRITKADALEAVANQEKKPAAPSAPVAEKPVQTAPSSVAAFSREEERKRMSRMRRTIADRLVRAKNQTAMLTTFNEVDLTEVKALRKKYQERFVEKYGIKLGFMSLFAKACSKVLMEMPAVNARIDGNELIYHNYVDISIAISTPTGLVVPPVRNVESLNFAEIEFKIKELAQKARKWQFVPGRNAGGHFYHNQWRYFWLYDEHTYTE